MSKVIVDCKVILGFLVHINWADTIWVKNEYRRPLGSREDNLIKFSRLYIKESKTYVWNIIIWKLKIRWAKI